MFVPVPQVTSVEKDRSTPYPCMNRPCGCASADQCWKQCCCFTNQQKVAWAKANNVELPEFVVAAANREAKENCHTAINCPNCLESEPSVKAAAKATNCSTEQSSKVAMRAAKATKPRSPSANADSKTSPEVSSEAASHFCGIAVLECRGLSSLWQILSLTMLSNSVELEECSAAIVQSTNVADDLLPKCERLPPEPPPIIGVAGQLSA